MKMKKYKICEMIHSDFKIVHGIVQAGSINVPHHQLAIHTRSAYFAAIRLFASVQTNACYGILMYGLDMGVRIFGAQITIQRLENAHCRNASRLFLLSLIQFVREHQLTAIGCQCVYHGHTAMTGHHNGQRRNPFTCQKWQEFGFAAYNQIVVGCIRNGNATVMTDPTDFVAITGKADSIDPATA